MNPRALFIITGDPRNSPRPAEAIRIAAGVGAWKKNDLSLYLRETAILALSEAADDFVDADNYLRYLPMMREWGRPVYVQRSSPWLAELGGATLPYREISDAELAGLAAEQDYVLRF